MEKQQQVLDFLNGLQIPFFRVEHPAAYIMEDIIAFGVTQHGHVCKNLFLRDAKGKRHFLVSLRGDKHADLKRLSAALDTRLSFASEQRLQQHLCLQKGEVSPLAVLFNSDCAVEVFLDLDLADLPQIGVHPGVNTATVFLSFPDLQAAVRAAGNPVTVLPL